MPYTYFDLTSAEIELLKLLGTAGVYTQQETSTFLQSVRGALQSATTTVTATISSGTASITRPERIFIAEIDTQGQASTDILDSLEPATGASFSPGDIVILKAASAGRIVTVDADLNKISLKSDYNLIEPTGRLGLIYVQYTGGEYQWAEMFRSNADGSIVANTLLFQSDAVQSITAGGEITITNSIIPIQSERSAETLATEDMVLTATGTNAVVTVFVDEGSGPFSIGSVTLSGTPTIPNAMISIVAAITAAATGYTAVDDGVDTITVTAPTGSGATANTYTLSYSTTSTFAATIVGSFSGGVDGSDQDDTLTVINGTQEGQMLILYNVMTANKITCSGANFSTSFVMQKSPIGYVVLFIINSVAVPFGSCCAQELTATRWVDPANTSGVSLKNMTYTYPTITAAIAASITHDEIVILPKASGAAYDERDFFQLIYVRFSFTVGAKINYTGAVDGGLFDDTASNMTTIIRFQTLQINDATHIGGFPSNYNAASAGTNRCAFNITDAATDIKVYGGTFGGADRAINVSNGFIEFHNSSFYSNGTETILVSGGTVVFRNCFIYQTTVGGVCITRSGGNIIFDNCTIVNYWNNAAGHAIKDTAAATTGKIVFIGTNRLIVSNAAAFAINATNAQNYKVMGKVYSNYGFGGTTPSDLITGAAMVMTTDTDVE